jgi:hypothetical protein
MTWAAVGTAAAIGAATGAGSSIIQGGDPDEVLTRALIGGATGAVTGGIGGGAESTVAPELLGEAGMQAVGSEVLQQGVESAVPELLSGAGSEFLSQAGQEAIPQITPEIISGAAQIGPPPPAGILAASPPPPVAAPLPTAGAPTGIQTASGPATSDVAGFQNDQAVVNMIKNYQGGPQPELSPEVLEAAGINQVASPTRMTEADLAQMTFAETGQYPNQPLISEPPGAMSDVSTGGSNLVSEPSTNPFMEGFASVKKYVKENPYKAAAIGYAGLNALSSLGPKEDPRKKKTYVNKYPISPNYQPSRPVPNVYQSRYAEGGITSFDDEAGVDQFAPGGSAREKRDPDADFRRYSSMMNARPEVEADEEALRKPRFARDDDADTRYQDALTAALIRRDKNNKRANIASLPVKRPTPLGTINLAPLGTQQAASGGIMGYNLGGYAAGGNPRLLKGPGDGMSDNIPAVIGRKQPARLADGEFVVPADVVSHLGNGSTDAGAKKLHQMMDRIRTDRTGKKKQAPEVNADKYLPGKKKASGGITGYAEGGAVEYAEGGTTYSDAQVAQAVAKSVADGFSIEQAVQGAIRNYGISPEQANKAAVTQLYTEQLGRAPDASGADYWTSQLNSGKTVQQVQAEIAKSNEGANFDTQGITSIYRQALGRNPEQEGYQYWKSVAQSGNLNADQLRDAIRTAAAVEQQQRGITEDFKNFEGSALENDPYGGRYATKSIYDIPTNAADRMNISTIDGRQVQFVNPVTQLAVISNFTSKGPGTTNKFSDAQVAAYLRDNAFSNPTQVNEALNMFGISPEQTRKATELLKNNDPSINAATKKYAEDIAANPAAVAENAAAIANATQFRFTAAPGQESLDRPRVIEAINRAYGAGSLTKAEFDTMLSQISPTNGSAVTNPADIRNILAGPKGNVVIDSIYGQQLGEDDDLNTALAEARLRQAELTKQDPGYYQASNVLGQAYLDAGLAFPFMSSTYKANTMATQANALTPQNLQENRRQLFNDARTSGPYRVQYDPITQNRTPLSPLARDPYSNEGLRDLYGRMMDQYGPPPAGFINPAVAQPPNPFSYQPPAVNNLTLNTPVSDAVATKAAGEAAAADAAAAAASSGNKAGGLLSIKHRRKA